MRGEILSANSKSLQIRKIILSIIFALLTVISLCMAGCKQESGNKPVPGPVDPIDPDIPDDPENPETQKIEINDVDAVVSLADAAVSEYFTASTEAEQIAALGKYASISDEKGGKSVRFSWKGNGSVKYTLYMADNERFENAKEYVASGLENELYVYNLVPSSAYYWKVCGTFDGDESATSHFTTESISLRCVFVDGAVNTRDIGGYAAANGSVNYGKIYRGGNLDSITTAGAGALKDDLQIKTEIDLRKDGARKNESLGLSYYKFDAGSYTDILDLAAWNALPTAARREFNAKYSAGIKNIFEILANEENYPVYIHCDNGADETGTIAFLINALLGVSESDLIRDFELSSFSAAAGNTYFCGTFDGRGHIFSAKVGENGVFGGLFNGAVIKNTEFIFEFSDKSSSCGLASNEATFNHQKGAVKLNNIAVKTKNYYLNSYALFAYCNFNLEMQDVYVNISGTEKLPDYTGVTTEMAALFHYDLTATMASNDGKFKGGFRNIFVVTGKFMPMACSKWRYSGYTYVSYAKNDEAHLGNFKPTGYDHLYTYCHVVADEDNDPQTLAYYGMLLYGGSAPRPFAWIFKARADITDGGIERYDTAFELSKKTDKIGDWNVT